jgi:hypothetical protein
MLYTHHNDHTADVRIFELDDVLELNCLEMGTSGFLARCQLLTVGTESIHTSGHGQTIDKYSLY